MDYISYCKNFFSATNIPTSLLKNGLPLYSALGELYGIEYLPQWDIYPNERNPEFRHSNSNIHLGMVDIEGTDLCIVVGPVFNIPVTTELIREFMRENATPLKYRDNFTEFFSAAPKISILQLARYLALIHQTVNHKEMDLHAYFEQSELDKEDRIRMAFAQQIHNQEYSAPHNSYFFETDIYQLIRNGELQKLQDYLKKHASDIHGGMMAHSLLRNAKNEFIAVCSRAGLIGAISGGADTNTIYQLMDLYIQECERMQSVEDIYSLHYVMLCDFCSKVQDNQIPLGISRELHQCMQFIRTHTNEKITIADVANHVHRSQSYLMKQFKEEMGIHIGALIMRCKMEDAKSLLRYTDKSLAEISSYLCFSSQSYFQSVFKKQYGMTPMQFRKKNQK